MPRRIFAITIVGIVLAEVAAMIVVYTVRDWSYVSQVILDAAIMMAIIFPLLYFLSFRPLLLHIQQRSRTENILQVRLRLMQSTNDHSLDELLQFTLDEIETLTGSEIGFFHFLEPDQETLRLQTWSSNTLRNMCTADGKELHYSIDQAGVWADAVRRRQPVIHNDYAALSYRKGMPVGHARVVRELVVPILRDQKVVAIIGVGNKPQDFTDNDVEVVATLADFSWDVIEHRRAEVALGQSEAKFRTLADWTYDWEMWLDPDGNIVYTSPSSERMTGYSPDELLESPDLMIRIVHPDDLQAYQQHHLLVHDESAGLSSIEYRIVSRDGRECWIEHVCRPLFGPDDHYLGRRISNREITERKQNEKRILEQNRKELILTRTLQTIQTDIARDLHDTLGQNISFLNMNLEHLSEVQWTDPGWIKTQVQKMTKVANESYQLIRAMLTILQSENTADPLNLFVRYGEQVAERSSFQIKITSQGKPGQLAPAQTRQLFYIFREALSNIEKHAYASRVAGEFIWDDCDLRISISDNGRGFEMDAVQSPDHYGLKFMRERASLMNGSISFHSVPGQGTTIRVIVPCEISADLGNGLAG